jgi:hypothetical protein
MFIKKIVIVTEIDIPFLRRPSPSAVADDLTLDEVVAVPGIHSLGSLPCPMP